MAHGCSAAAAAAAASKDAASITCDYCVNGTQHPQFATFLTDSRLTPNELMTESSRTGKSQKQRVSVSNAYWDYTRQPTWNLFCHNRDPRFRIGPKATKHMAPFVHNELVFSNFVCHAGLFVALIRKSSRRFKSHITRSVRLAKIWHHIDKSQRGKPIQIYVSDAQGHQAAWEAAYESSIHSPNEIRRIGKLIDNATKALEKQHSKKETMS